MLDVVDLKIRAGDCIGLLSRNGPGKITLIKVLNGDIVSKSGGRVGGSSEGVFFISSVPL